MAHKLSFVGKNKSFFKLLSLAVIVIGLSAGVILASSKMAVFTNPDAAPVGPTVRTGGDCTTARTSCLSGNVCVKVSGYNFAYMCVDNKCPGWNPNSGPVCANSNIYSCVRGAFVKGMDCGGSGCYCKDSKGAAICCNKITSPRTTTTPKPTQKPPIIKPTPVPCTTRGGRCGSGIKCCSGLSCRYNIRTGSTCR